MKDSVRTQGWRKHFAIFVYFRGSSFYASGRVYTIRRGSNEVSGSIWIRGWRVEVAGWVYRARG